MSRLLRFPTPEPDPPAPPPAGGGVPRWLLQLLTPEPGDPLQDLAARDRARRRVVAGRREEQLGAREARRVLWGRINARAALRRSAAAHQAAEVERLRAELAALVAPGDAALRALPAATRAAIRARARAGTRRLPHARLRRRVLALRLAIEAEGRAA